MTTFTFQRGEPITVQLVVNDAGEYHPADLTLAMALKAKVDGRLPPRGTESVATFAVSFVPAAGADPAYWNATIAAANTANLQGFYVTDGQIANGATVIAVTTPATIIVSESVTPA